MPTPRSILLHVDNTARAAVRLRVARQLADAFDARVTVQPAMLSGMVRYPVTWEGASAAATLMQAYDQECLARAHACFERERAGSDRLQWAQPLPQGPHGVAGRALYADLVLLGQRDANDPAADEVPPDFVADVLLRGGRPTLILPFAGPAQPLGGTVLVAWKASREAARAVTAALPWLQRARRIHVLCCDGDAAASLELLAARLAGHGVRIDRHDGGAEPDEVGDLLLSTAADLDADLLVMGGYGHSRAREWVMGGATDTVLRSMTLPVLMSH